MKLIKYRIFMFGIVLVLVNQASAATMSESGQPLKEVPDMTLLKGSDQGKPASSETQGKQKARRFSKSKSKQTRDIKRSD